MEKRRQSSSEARAASIAAFFNKESKKISDKLEKARSLGMGVDTKGTVTRRQREVLHLEERQAELSHTQSFVLGILGSTKQTSEVPGIKYYFLGKLDEIDLEIERIQSHPHGGVIVEKGTIKGKRQELDHLNTIRADMLRIGNHVQGLLGEPPLALAKDESG